MASGRAMDDLKRDALRRRAAVEGPALLAELGWIRRLARRLVVDEEHAEDLVQDTCLVLLERRPRDLERLRQWVGAVMRNLVRQRIRGEGRREARERAQLPERVAEAPAELVERVAMQRQLTEAVLALHEPYQSTLLLRYFEELAPRDIARRQGVPVATVQSRLNRGLALLRERLDASHGRAHWAALLVPSWGAFRPLPMALTGGLLVNVKLLAALLAVVLSVGWMVLWSPGMPAGGVSPLPDAPGRFVPSPVGSSAQGESFRPGVERRDAVPRPEPAALPRTPAIASAVVPGTALPGVTSLVRVRVLDDAGDPLAGVRLEPVGQEALLSGPGGWVAFETTARSLELRAADPDWVTVRVGRWGRDARLDPVVIVARATRVAGRVLEETGRGVAGVRVELELPRDFHARFGDVLDATATRSFQASSGTRGEFLFERLPAVRGARLAAACEGYLPARVTVPDLPEAGLLLVLARPELPPEGLLRGRVVDARGQAVAGARVGCGLASVLCDQEGEFSLALAAAVSADRIHALKEGFLPARMDRPGPPDAELGGWPAYVTLTLPGPAARLTGRVLDHEGKPVRGARLWLADPTPSSPVGRMPTHLEHLMAGAPVPADVLRGEGGHPQADGDDLIAVQEPAGAPSALWSWVSTATDGSFELPGLERRPYRLVVLPHESLERTELGPFDPEAGPITIHLPAPDRIDVVAGRVRSRDGRALPGVLVHAFLPVVDLEGRVFGGRARWSLSEAGPQTTTDAEGRFRFEDLPRHGVRLSFEAEGVLPTSLSLEDESRPRALEIEVDLRCHLEVVLADPGRADRLRVVDGDGQPLEVLLISDGNIEALDSAPLHGGRTGVVSVSSTARELWLYSGSERLDRRGIELRVGQVTEIRW